MSRRRQELLSLQESENLKKEMKEYFKTDNLQEIFVKLGFAKTTANNFYGKNLLNTQIAKEFEYFKLKHLPNKVNNINQPQPAELVEFRYFPDVYASAGFGTSSEALDFEVVKLDKFFVNHLLGIPASKHYDILKIYGESMQPFIQNGALAIVDTSKNSLSLVKNKEVIIIKLDGELYCKRLKKAPLSDEFILSSDNEDFKDYLIKKERLSECEILGVVVCVCDVKILIHSIKQI